MLVVVSPASGERAAVASNLVCIVNRMQMTRAPRVLGFWKLSCDIPSSNIILGRWLVGLAERAENKRPYLGFYCWGPLQLSLLSSSVR